VNSFVETVFRRATPPKIIKLDRTPFEIQNIKKVRYLFIKF